MNNNDVEALEERIAELEAELLESKRNYAGAMHDLDHFEPLASERKEIIDHLEAQNEKLAEALEELQGEHGDVEAELVRCREALDEVVEFFDNFFYSAGLNVMHDAKKIIKNYDIDI